MLYVCIKRIIFNSNRLYMFVLWCVMDDVLLQFVCTSSISNQHYNALLRSVYIFISFFWLVLHCCRATTVQIESLNVICTQNGFAIRIAIITIIIMNKMNFKEIQRALQNPTWTSALFYIFIFVTL